MIEREWAAILARFGQEVTLTETGAEAVSVRAFLQPILEKQPQLEPSPLGARREERWLYLGPPEQALTAGETAVLWGGRGFTVETAHTCRAVSTVNPRPSQRTAVSPAVSACSGGPR